MPRKSKPKPTPCEPSTLPPVMSISEKQIRDSKRMGQWSEKELEDRLAEIDRESGIQAERCLRNWNAACRLRELHGRFLERYNEARRYFQSSCDERRVIKREIGLRQTMPTIQERDT